MNRADMINELLERIEAELDEATTGQLAAILEEYEHIPMLSNVLESLDDEEELDEDAEDVDALPLVDDEWSDDEAEEDEE